MRLSEWRASAPVRDGGGAKVAAVVDPVLAALGAEPDPHVWVAWGDEPANRYTIFVPTDPGLISCFVRANVAGEGPRATTKLIRWNRVSIGELGVETQGGHRMLSFQLESQVIRGVDAEADRAAAFAVRVIAAIDGRPLPPAVESRARRGAAGVRAKGGAAAKGAAGRSAATTSSPATTRSGAASRTAAGARTAKPATGRGKGPSNAG
jgi:hypothetical protein